MMMLRPLVLLVLFLPGMSMQAQERLRPERPVTIVGGMLLEGYEAPPIHHSVVVFDEGRIVSVGARADTPVPEDAVVIDAGGRTVLPDLIDTHVHVDLIGHGDYVRFYEFLPGMERIDEVMPIGAKKMLRAGVTSAHDLGAPFQVLALRERIERGDIPGPRLTISGPWITRTYLDSVPGEYQVMIDSPSARVRDHAPQYPGRTDDLAPHLDLPGDGEFPRAAARSRAPAGHAAGYLRRGDGFGRGLVPAGTPRLAA